MIRQFAAAASVLALLGVTACASTDTSPTAAASPAPAAKAAPAPNPAIAMGGEVFTARCSGCHSGTGSAPGRQVLAKLTPSHIVMALTSGKMAAQGRNLTEDDKKNVATFLTAG